MWSLVVPQLLCIIKIFALKFIKYTFLFALLTILSQVGGLLLLCCIPLFKWIDQNAQTQLQKAIFKPLSFLAIYLIFALVIIPPLASLNGRVPLPIKQEAGIQPLTVLTCLLNRHYVTPELKSTILKIGEQMQAQDKGSVIAYLDANFPFIDGFPLFFHLSHNDGKKLDLAFFYKNEKGEPLNGVSPSWSGYGVYDVPKKGEVNTTTQCKQKGGWQYDMTKYLSFFKKNTLQTDETRTKTLLKIIAKHPKVGKVFLEPHLKTRWGLQSISKIRFHGCQAVRHDDHIHLQL